MTLLEQLIKSDFGLDSRDGRYRKAIRHDSLVYDAKKNVFFWNSKDIAGGTMDYLLKVRKLPFSEAREIFQSEDGFLPDNYIAKVMEDTADCVVTPDLVNIFYTNGFNNRDYWHEKRGYTDGTIEKFRLGFTGEWFTIPIFENGEFVNFQLRKEFPKKAVSLWYKNKGPHAFNFSQLAVTSWVVITEGPPDCIMLRQNDIPAISQTSGSNYWDKKWNYSLMRMKEIYIVYDNDEAGYKGSINLAKHFGYKAKIYNYPDSDKKGYDSTDYFKEGHTKEDFLELLKKGKYYWEMNNG